MASQMRPTGLGSRVSRRAALLLPLAAAGCSTWDDWFGTTKVPLPGTREAILAARHGLAVDNPPGRPVSLPEQTVNAEWLQPGGTPAHVMGNLAARDALASAWSASAGTGGGYRRKLTSRPVSGGGRVFTMDSGGAVSAFDVKTGSRVWNVSTQPAEADSTNVGGGIALDGDIVYAATGIAEVLALEAASGKILWRKPLPAAARSAPTVADGRLYIATLDSQLIAVSAADGARQWAYQAVGAETGLLGLPAPAFADGLVVAGFGSGDLACVRASSGTVTWTESLASVRGRNSLVDLSAIRGMPVIVDGRVYAVGLGGLLICVDLRSGRRLWQRDAASQETPWLAGDWLFLLTEDQAVAAINRQDGAVAWITQLPRWENVEKQQDPINWVGPVLAGGRLLVAGSTKAALSIDPLSGKILATQDLPGAPALAPVVVDGTVLQLTDDGTLLAMR